MKTVQLPVTSAGKMTNLTSTAQLVKKIFPFLGFLIIVILLIVAIFYRYKQPLTPPSQPKSTPISPPIITQNPLQTSSPTLDFSQTPTLQVPAELPIFTAQKISLTNNAAQSLGSSFGIASPPFLVEENTLNGKQYTFRQGNISLTLNETSIRYENYSPSSTSESNLPQSELANMVLPFIKRLPLTDKDLSINHNLTKFQTITTDGLEDSIGSAATFQEASVVEYFFEKKLSSDYPLIGPTPEVTFARVKINKSGEIIYLRAMLFENFNEQSPYQLKTPDEAINEVLKGSGKIVQTLLLDENNQANELFRTGPVDIKSANIKKVYLAYLLPDDVSEPIQPIYVFEGKFQNELTQNGNVVIYLPAIKNLRNPQP